MQYSRRIIGQLLTDIVLVNLAAIIAILVRLEFHKDDSVHYLLIYVTYIPIITTVRILSLYLFRAYRIHWRYVSIYDFQMIAYATTASSLVIYLATLAHPGYPRGAMVIEWGANIFLIIAARVFFRWLDYRSGKPLFAAEKTRKQKTLIVGASDAGEMVARELLRQNATYKAVGFVDNDLATTNVRIHGLPVLGKISDIPAIVSGLEVENIVIAMPGALGSEIRDVLSLCESTGAQLRILPGVAEVMRAGSPASEIREVRIEDLLRRPPVRTDLEQIAGYIRGKRVMVTGAGGSIGSELCRQIARLDPAALLLFGHGENGVFEIQQELLRTTKLVPIPLIGSVQDRQRLRDIFSECRPEVVFHAAAHKHVPMMEMNPCEAVKNNVVGTRNLAEISVQYGVAKFIYVSTDKAVNPISIMGSSKRVGEMVIQSVQPTGDTEFAAVRFGNVLGSRGSVIPIMKRQISQGGPVTVTHPDMTRYFMTIPEAVALILQAGAIGHHGEIFVLDMGEPVKISDLARDLIRLSGFVPDQDVKIIYTGIRPGEKIFEELLTSKERQQTTTHEKIFVAHTGGVDPATLKANIELLAKLAYDEDVEGVRTHLVAIANGHPSKPEMMVPG
jgi:FlaA1/EpsC-like NDP-sugar epimerase